MRRKTMAQRVDRHWLGNTGNRDGLLKRTLQTLFKEVVPTLDTATRIN